MHECQAGCTYFNCIKNPNFRVELKTGLDYTKFSQIIVSIVLAYLRIIIYAYLKLMHCSPGV
jgi:hypothetical protein